MEDFKKTKSLVIAEASIRKRFGTESIIDFLLTEVYRNDEERTKRFLLSSEGGFEQKEVDRVFYKRHHRFIKKQELYYGIEAL